MNRSFAVPSWLLLLAVSFSGCVPAAAETATFAPTATLTSPPAENPLPSAQAAPAETTAVPFLPSGDSEHTVDVSGQLRTYLLHVPPGLKADARAPLVFAFHGNKMDAAEMRTLTGFNDVSDAGGFLVVYPLGTGLPGALSFNAGTCCGFAEKFRTDDIAFVRRMLADLEGYVPYDPRRVYSTGFSNGAMFSYRLACEMSDAFAAVASVSGTVTVGPCRPQYPISVLHIYGSIDRSIPPSGWNTNPDASSAFLSVEQCINEWKGINGCPDKAPAVAEGAAAHTVYSPCRTGAALEVYVIRGVTHKWPPADLFPTAQTIWKFFAGHPKI